MSGSGIPAHAYISPAGFESELTHSVMVCDQPLKRGVIRIIQEMASGGLAGGETSAPGSNQALP